MAEKHWLDEHLDNLFGEGPIDPDTFSSKDLERDRRIRENIQKINSSRFAKGDKKEAPVSPSSVTPECHPCQPPLSPLSATVVTLATPECHPCQPPVSPFSVTPECHPLEDLETGEFPLLDEYSYTQAIKFFKGSAQRKIIKYIQRANQRILFTSSSEIAEELDISQSMVKKTFYKLQEAGIILAGAQSYDRKKRMHGQKIIFCGPLDEEKERTVSPYSDTPQGQPLSPSKIDRSLKDKNLSILETMADKILSWTDEQMQQWYPLLAKAGFRSAQIQQIVENLQARLKPLDLVPVSLEYAEWELAHGKMVDKEGRAVEDPASFVFSSLSLRGCYRRPKGYKDELEEALDAEKNRQAKREKLEEEAFQNWLDSLSDKDREEFEKERTAKAFPEPASIFLRAKWKEIASQ